MHAVHTLVLVSFWLASFAVKNLRVCVSGQPQTIGITLLSRFILTIKEVKQIQGTNWQLRRWQVVSFFLHVYLSFYVDIPMPTPVGGVWTRVVHLPSKILLSWLFTLKKKPKVTLQYLKTYQNARALDSRCFADSFWPVQRLPRSDRARLEFLSPAKNSFRWWCN